MFEEFKSCSLGIFTCQTILFYCCCSSDNLMKSPVNKNRVPNESPHIPLRRIIIFIKIFQHVRVEEISVVILNKVLLYKL